MRFTIFTAIFILLSAVALPSTIYVPDNYAKIQAAIYYASNGDTVVVRPGTYKENIDFLGREITVISEQGPYVTTIDGNQAGSVVTFRNGETRCTVLEGFTIRNGTGTRNYRYTEGGGIFCSAASPIISNNIVRNNMAGEFDRDGNGGGILCRESNAIIVGNAITDNKLCHKYAWQSSGSGGGICCISSSGVIVLNNTISNNLAYGYTDGGEGGGIYCSLSSCIIINNTIGENEVDGGLYTGSMPTGGGISILSCSPSISSNVIAGNVAYDGEGGGIYSARKYLITVNNTIVNNMGARGGGIFVYLSTIDTANTILWNNSANPGPEVFISHAPATLNINCSDVDGGKASCYVSSGGILNWGPGMIDADPLFADLTNKDYHLTWNSPCRDTGDNTAVSKRHDFEGDPRIVGTVDMGADEYYYHLYSAGDVLPGRPIDIKVVGTPGLTALLALGTGTQDPPTSTPHGNLWLKLPLARSWQLGPIPGNGILTHTVNVPSGWPSGSTHPFQALVGPWGGGTTRLTNLHVLTVR